MDIKIGDKALSATRPADLDQRLIDATGCNAAETLEMLSNPARGATPSMIAMALHPALSEDVSVADLAEQIAAADPVAVREQVIALLKEGTADGEAAAQ